MKKSLLQAVNFAWHPLKDSLTVKIFGIVTIVEAIGALFDWQKRLKELGALPDWAPTLNFVVYVIIVLFFARSTFSLAVRAGEAEDALSTANSKLKAYTGMCSGMHDMIHTTRDGLLAGDGFKNLLALSQDESAKHLWDTWQTQLGLLEKSLRKLTQADCSACIKIVKKDALSQGVDGLSTVCYSPAVSIERRKKSLVLPLNQGIAQEALITRDIAFSNDILQDERFWPRDDRAKLSKLYRTVVASPILVNSQAQGVLCIDWKEPQSYRPDEHRDVVACFTDLISTACYINHLSRILMEKK